MRDQPTDGERGDLTAEFVSRRVINCDGQPVRRLLVKSDGRRHAVFVDPAVSTPVDLRAGDRYRFTDVLWCTTASESAPERCESCGATLRKGTVLDAYPALREAADRIISDRMAIVTKDSGVVAADDDQGVDDWTEMRPAEESPVIPEVVCPDCGATPRRQVGGTERASTGNPATVANQVASSMAAPADTSVGLATGGAADASNFRENVRNGYTPQPEALATEGLFYDYYFETQGVAPETDALFAPRYATAVSEHPVTGDTGRFLAVGLDSNLSVEAFERPPLDLVAVLDVSGSMDSSFDQYYYDEHGRRRETDAGEETKLEAAIEALCALTEQLDADDRLGVVLYNNRSHVAKPLRDIASTDMRAIRQHIRDIRAGGGTNLADGFEAAWELLADTTTATDREQRVVFLTDMMPNTGATGEDELTSLFADAAADGVHTTFVGMGLDENADLAGALSGIRGANHYFVTSGKEFRRRLGDEFDYMVTPLVYDLALDVEAEGYDVAAVHGSPTAAVANNRLMHVGTLFPSSKQDGRTRGGIVLVELERTEAASDCSLVASWTGRNGEEHTQRVTIDLPDDPETFAHDGVRKAVALARYAETMRGWARAVRQGTGNPTGVDDWLLPDERSEHEQTSVSLAVPDEWAERFAVIQSYLDETMAVVGDEDLQQELDLLDTLRAAARGETERNGEVTD